MTGRNNPKSNLSKEKSGRWVIICQEVSQISKRPESPPPAVDEPIDENLSNEAAAVFVPDPGSESMELPPPILGNNNKKPRVFSQFEPLCNSPEDGLQKRQTKD